MNIIIVVWMEDEGWEITSVDLILRFRNTTRQSMEVMMMLMTMARRWWWRWMRAPPDLSGDEGGSLLASSPTGSFLAARFSRTVVSLNIVSPSRLHRAKVFKVLSPSPYRTAEWYGRPAVPLVVKSASGSDLILFPCVVLESPLMLDFLINSTIFDPFAMNAYISFSVSNPGKTHQ